MRLDLHMHTDRSDGAWSPEQLLAEVEWRQLSCWAVTDHDTLAAWPSIRDSSGSVPGAELTAWSRGREVHIVGLGVDPQDAVLQGLIATIQAVRRRRAQALLARVASQIGHELDAGFMDSLAVVTRSHVARALVDQQVVGHVREAFTRFLGDDVLADEEPPGFPAIPAVVAAIHAAGGVSLLAHPALYKDIAFIEALIDEGLDGLEVSHRGCERSLSRLFKRLAKNRGLLMSCGSDFHHPHPCRIGEWSLSEEEFAPLRERLRPWGA